MASNKAGLTRGGMALLAAGTLALAWTGRGTAGADETAHGSVADYMMASAIGAMRKDGGPGRYGAAVPPAGGGALRLTIEGRTHAFNLPAGVSLKAATRAEGTRYSLTAGSVGFGECRAFVRRLAKDGPAALESIEVNGVRQGPGKDLSGACRASGNAVASHWL